MVYDCFTFFNELDLLELRLSLLDKYIDKFIIAEANLTHSGLTKPFYFEINKDRFSRWEHKIQYIKVILSTEGLIFNENESAYNPKNGSWVLENRQREALGEIKNHVNADDLIIVSDLDEIPNPKKIKKLTTENAMSLRQINHYYFLNCQASGKNRKWNGSVICNGDYFIKNGAQFLRDHRNIFKRIKNGGWHFSYLGGIEAIQKKLKSFSHTEFNKDAFSDVRHIEKCLQEGRDLFNRDNMSYKFVPLFYYPAFLRKRMLKYSSLSVPTPWYRIFF